MSPELNLIGPQVRQWQTEKGWSQDELATKLQLRGWSISRNSLAKLELQLRRVSDCELLFLAKVFSVGMEDLFPKSLSLKKIGPQFQAGSRPALFPARGEK